MPKSLLKSPMELLPDHEAAEGASQLFGINSKYSWEFGVLVPEIVWKWERWDGCLRKLEI